MAALTGVAKRIRSYAGQDPEMRALVAELETGVREVASPMAEGARKQMFFASYATAKRRTVDGKAMRRPPTEP
jgi:hypothetical protein